MTARSHLAFAMSCWWLYSLLMNYTITGYGSLLAAIGGLLPDLDHPKSTLGRRLPIISYPLSKLLGHRGFTHSLIATILMAGAVSVLTASPHLSAWQWSVLPLCLGYLSHIAGDALTPSGVPLFYPKRKTYSLNLFRTNSLQERVFVGMLTMLVFVLGGIGEKALLHFQSLIPFPF